MALGDTPITLIGNVVADPELRFTPSGAAVANVRVASTPRVRNKETNQWEDGDALFLTCNIWNQMAENLSNTIHKGDRVIVNGFLKQRSYQTKEGENRTVYEIEVEEIGPSLKFASAQVNRNPSQNQQGGGNFGGQQQQGGYQQPQQQPGQHQGGFGGQQQPQQGQGGYNPQQGGFGGQGYQQAPQQ